MKTPFTGGCYCGAVRYECTPRADQVQMFRCHCRDCQQVSGGAYVPVVLMPKETFRLTRGVVHHFDTQGEEGPHTRGFCAACGSRLTGGESPAGSPVIGVTAASLDDPSGFTPTFDIWVADAQPWDASLGSSTRQYEKYAPG